MRVAPTAPGQAADPRPLRVGVVQNAMPCSDLGNGQAPGAAVDLWQAIAAAARGEVDVAIS